VAFDGNRYSVPRAFAFGMVTVKGFVDRIAILYLKLFHRIYAPLTAGIMEPVPWDDRAPPPRRALLDRLYAAVDRDLNQLFESIGVRSAA
jgi:hypothetical protein